MAEEQTHLNQVPISTFLFRAQHTRPIYCHVRRAPKTFIPDLVLELNLAQFRWNFCQFLALFVPPALTCMSTWDPLLQRENTPFTVLLLLHKKRALRTVERHAFLPPPLSILSCVSCCFSLSLSRFGDEFPTIVWIKYSWIQLLFQSHQILIHESELLIRHFLLQFAETHAVEEAVSPPSLPPFSCPPPIPIPKAKPAAAAARGAPLNRGGKGRKRERGL